MHIHGRKYFLEQLAELSNNCVIFIELYLKEHSGLKIIFQKKVVIAIKSCYKTVINFVVLNFYFSNPQNNHACMQMNFLQNDQ